MRDRLIELVKPFVSGSACELESGSCEFTDCRTCNAQDLANRLLANGVIVPPCKIGDKLYIVTAFSKEIVESVVLGLWLADGVFSLFTIHGTIMANLIGENVFLTKEEAEQALKEREQSGYKLG